MRHRGRQQVSAGRRAAGHRPALRHALLGACALQFLLVLVSGLSRWRRGGRGGHGAPGAGGVGEGAQLLSGAAPGSRGRIGAAAEEAGLKVDLMAPTKETPSMTMALEKYIKALHK